MTRRRLFAARSISSSRQPANQEITLGVAACGKTCSAQNPGGSRKKMQKRHLRSLDLADDQSIGHAQRWSACRSLGFQADRLPGARPQRGPGSAFAHRTVFVSHFTSDYCLGLIMWLELTRKRDQHDNRLPDHLPVKQSEAWCRFGTVISQNMQRSPASEPSRP